MASRVGNEIALALDLPASGAVNLPNGARKETEPGYERYAAVFGTAISRNAIIALGRSARWSDDEIACRGKL